MHRLLTVYAHSKNAGTAMASDKMHGTVVDFWDARKYRFCPDCQMKAFAFAEAYADDWREIAQRLAIELRDARKDSTETGD